MVRIASAALALTVAGQATAADLFSRDTLSGVAILGIGGGRGEASWLDRGPGKLRQAHVASASADVTVAWRPGFGDRTGAVVTLQAQNLSNGGVGIGEAYLRLRPDPASAVRLSGRAGVFFPPLSLEHDGSEWTPVRTLTPSAINSWVAEEVKTAGVEGRIQGKLAGRPASLTAAAFQGDDTAAALLFYRGWALHDVRSTLGGKLPLPATPSLFRGGQAPDTRSTIEVDGRWGGYAKLEVAATDALQLSLFVYDNNGDPTALRRGQYAWRTRFGQASVRLSAPSGGEIIGQAMSGDTAMGPLIGGIRPASIGFESVFVLASQPIGRATLSVRADYFAISDRTLKALNNNAEHGWALTGDWIQPLTPRIGLATEAVFTRSDRPDRLRFGLARRQDELELRSAVRLAF